MAETEGVLGGDQGPQGEAPETFKKSFLVQSGEELKSITNENLRRRLNLLHVATQGEVLNKEAWRQEYLSIMRKTADGEYPEEETAPFLARIQDHVEKTIELGEVVEKGAAAGGLAVAGLALGDEWVEAKAEAQKAKEERVTKERNVRDLDKFIDVHKVISTGKFQGKDVSDDDLRFLWNKRQDLYDEANSIGVFDQAREQILEKVKNSKWGDVRDNIEELSENLERNAMGMMAYDGIMAYREREDLHGIVGAGVRGIALQISDEGYKQVENDEEVLKRNNITKDAILRNRQRLGREAFMPLDFNPHDYVADAIKKQKSEEDQTYTKLRDERENQLQETLGDFLEKQVEISEEDRKAFFVRYEDQVRMLSEVFGHSSPEKEKENWVDLEYRQDFWTRFEPRSWPRFYEAMEVKERRIWDARWQLARAAFFKKIYSAFPEKQVENQDLTSMQKEHMEILYNIQGVREMLEEYTKMLISGRLTDSKGNSKSIWDITDETQFEDFRVTLRKGVLEKGKGFTSLGAKEADAVAWNLIWVTNLVESLDSRYGGYSSDYRHDGLPPAIVSDDIRSTLHPQEKFEDKSRKNQEWGAFGKWGKTQIESIVKRASRKNGIEDKDVGVTFNHAPLSRFWDWEKVKIEDMKDIDDIDRRREKKVYIRIYSPECYPTKALGSFWEEVPKVKVKDKEKTLLECLIDKDKIPWEDVNAASWIIYLPIKFNKAVKLSEYFAGKVPINMQEYGGVRKWADPLTDVYTRLGLKGKLNAKTFRNLKAWVVYASTGGVGNVESSRPSLNLSILGDRFPLEVALRHKNVRYLAKGDELDIV